MTLVTRSKRKPHNQKPGYIASRINLLTGRQNVIYIAVEQGIDASGGKYAVVCDAHAELWGETSIPRARVLMKNAEIFCNECAKLAAQKEA